MIGALLKAGVRLAGKRDPRLARGLCWAMLEGACAALPYMLLYGPLSSVLEDRFVTPLSLLGYTLAMIACVALRILCGMRGMPLIFAAAYAMMGQARLRIADHLRRLPLGWFARQRSGELSARLSSDINLIEQLWSHFMGTFVSGLTMSTLLLAFLLYLDWQLALICAVTLPLAALALAWAQHVAAMNAA